MGRPPPSYAVLRFESWPTELVPVELEGRWLEVPDPRTTVDGCDGHEVGAAAAAIARPTGRFEVRPWDGAVAEVWAVARPASEGSEGDG